VVLLTQFSLLETVVLVVVEMELNTLILVEMLDQVQMV
jgi:hypothetical protein|tara:strand:- start:81 stop:194 length:114 start_codon:yes stop_codon:yes gene_type:complete